MKKVDVAEFDEKDIELVNILTSLGVKKISAKVLVYLNSVEEAQSRDIEIATGLRQPEVSLAIKELKADNHVKERQMKKEGKGRPLCVYSKAMSLTEFVPQLEERIKKQAQAQQDNISKLRTLATAVPASQ